MKLSIERETLLQPLQTVIGVVERRQTLPILANVLLAVKDGHLAVTATDMEIELIANQFIQSSTESSVQLTVSGRKLLDIFRTFPEDAAIDLQQDKERLIVRSGQSRFILATLPVASFPKFEAMPPALTLSLTQKELSALLQACHFSMAQQDVRYYLNGMLFDIRSDEMRTAATDGHRFAMSHKAVHVMGEKAQVILPRKAVLELLRLLKQDDSKLDVEIGENYLRVKNESFTFTSRLIDGRFPEYERILPKEAGNAISLNKNALKNALLRVAILSNEKCRVVHLQLRAEFLHILANNPEQEEAEEVLSVDYAGKELDIAFNVSYLLDVLNAVSNETIRLTFIDANNRMLIEEVGNDSHMFLIMPLQI
jgi:DNA polymerase-3 subunit beta